MKYKNLEELIEVVKKLRAPDGCPWDREQTHRSLRPNMLEEAYEAVDAIDDNDMAHLKEELGDVLLQVLLHSQIASEEGAFDIDDVANELKTKLIHRHPHVFGNAKINTADEVKAEWDKLKAEEKTERVLVYLRIRPFTEDELNTNNTTPIEFIDQKTNSIISKKK
jgi:tetrapyrrole methylase family protein/MazG family protein